MTDVAYMTIILSKHKKPFISAPEHARTGLSVFLACMYFVGFDVFDGRRVYDGRRIYDGCCVYDGRHVYDILYDRD